MNGCFAGISTRYYGEKLKDPITSEASEVIGYYNYQGSNFFFHKSRIIEYLLLFKNKNQIS